MFDAGRRAAQIEFIDMPETLRGQYQYFTEARSTACAPPAITGQFTPLEEGVRRYVQDYLQQPDPYV